MSSLMCILGSKLSMPALNLIIIVFKVLVLTQKNYHKMENYFPCMDKPDLMKLHLASEGNDNNEPRRQTQRNLQFY